MLYDPKCYSLSCSCGQWKNYYQKYLNFYDKNIICLACHKKYISCDMKYSSCETRCSLFFLWQDIHSKCSFIHRKSVLWHKMFCFIPVTGNKSTVTGRIKNTSSHRRNISWCRRYTSCDRLKRLYSCHRNSDSLDISCDKKRRIIFHWPALSLEN